MQAEALVFVFGVLVILIFVMLVDRGRRVRIEEAERKQRRAEAAAEAEEDRELQRTIQVAEARARARLAFPSLLDETEALPQRSIADISRDEYEIIDRAQSLLNARIERLETENPHVLNYHSDTTSRPAREWRVLQELREILDTAYEDEPGLGNVREYLGRPARIIDCGLHGEIKLYSAEQVLTAQDEAGVTEYLRFARRYNRAPSLAKQILRRVEQADKERQERERAYTAGVTTKVEELPPLPTVKPPNRAH